MQTKVLPQSMLPRKLRLPRSRQGIALVIVLAILVLITGLVVAFFSSVTNELTAAKSYAGGSSSKQLADSATQLAIGTIRKATSQTKDGSGTDVAWASQPGMIRTWDNNGTALTCYKLFSSDNLEASAPYTNTTDSNDFNQNFDGSPALFTDLNAPVLDASNTPHYPIVDPRAALDSSENKLSFPQIQGFSIDTSQVPAVNSVKYNPNIARAPMPVRWMYVLQDGTLSVPTGGTTTATFGANAPTSTNPIIGRIAYWTDDDSCKVNINTASEGVYWDMPHLFTNEDVGVWSGSGTTPTTSGLSVCQPALGEYQRYPGHPATTSLSPILAYTSNPLLPTLTVPTATAAAPNGGVINASNYLNFKPYYDLVPRISWGESGSQGSQASHAIPNRNTLTGGQLGSITTDNDRLFASVDEFLFQQPLGTESSSSYQRQVYPLVLTSTTGTSTTPANVTQALEKAKFFLTAHSSAPEVTIFNTPRISMWPVWTAANKRTTLDNTLAFCADLKSGGVDTPYYFVRSNARSTTTDFTDPSNARNPVLYNYLLKLTSLPVPGFGGAFNSAAALGPLDSVQVITSIFDYIRCINMHDTSSGATYYVPNVTMSNVGTYYGGGEVLPIRIANGSFPGGSVGGFGRYATVSGMDIAFCGVPAATDSAGSTTTARVQAILVPTLFSPMQGLPGMFPKMYYTITGQYKFTLNGISIFKEPGSTGGEGTNWITNAPVQDTLGRGMGSMISPRASLERFGPFLNPGEEKNVLPGAAIAPSSPLSAGVIDNTTTPGSGVYPFISYYAADGTPNIPLTASTSTSALATAPTSMSFTGGALQVKLFAADTNELLQTVNLTMPNAPNLPVPNVSKAGLFFGDTSLLPKTQPGYKAGRINFRATDDVVRGVEVGDPRSDMATDVSTTNTSAGDVRLVAALKTVGPNPNYFHAHQNWASSKIFAATGIEDDDGSNGQELGDTANTLTASGQFSAAGSHGALAPKMNPRGSGSALACYQYKSPYVPSRTYTTGLLGVTRTNNSSVTPGDWDTGFALLPDGAHINMGDIGDGQYVDQAQYPLPGFVGLARYPYVLKEDHFNNDNGAGSYFSPNRQVPSSMMLGSIPTGIQRQMPWQTLLFNPKPEDLSHPGRWQVGSVPPDHLIADFFWMPVVQPYPISQPFSTAGKINMNYQIEPFNYITRASGIYALMKATKMMAIPASIYTGRDPKPLLSYINDVNNGTPPRIIPPDQVFRYPINVDETLGGFTDKFATNDIFRSASQIAELNLVPLGASGSPTHDTASMASFWNTHTMTGDNVREKPYVDLYPRLTTKSNAYTVHFRVQVLQKVPGTAVTQWVEGKDQVISEYRGSSEIERYLDSSATNLPDFASLMANSPTDHKLNLDNYYRYRVVSTKRFSPY